MRLGAPTARAAAADAGVGYQTEGIACSPGTRGCAGPLGCSAHSRARRRPHDAVVSRFSNAVHVRASTVTWCVYALRVWRVLRLSQNERADCLHGAGSVFSCESVPSSSSNSRAAPVMRLSTFCYAEAQADERVRVSPSETRAHVQTRTSGPRSGTPPLNPCPLFLYTCARVEGGSSDPPGTARPS